MSDQNDKLIELLDTVVQRAYCGESVGKVEIEQAISRATQPATQTVEVDGLSEGISDLMSNIKAGTFDTDAGSDKIYRLIEEYTQDVLQSQQPAVEALKAVRGKTATTEPPQHIPANLKKMGAEAAYEYGQDDRRRHDLEILDTAIKAAEGEG